MLQGSTSSVLKVTSGVPQGSILGPLLFIIVMDSITAINLSIGADLGLYADNISYYKRVALAEDCSVVESDVSLIKSWIEKSDLRLNVRKRKAMMVTPKKQMPSLAIEIGGNIIECVQTFRYLGIHLSLS